MLDVEQTDTQKKDLILKWGSHHYTPEHTGKEPNIRPRKVQTHSGA